MQIPSIGSVARTPPVCGALGSTLATMPLMRRAIIVRRAVVLLEANCRPAVIW